MVFHSLKHVQSNIIFHYSRTRTTNSNPLFSFLQFNMLILQKPTRTQNESRSLGAFIAKIYIRRCVCFYNIVIIIYAVKNKPVLHARWKKIIVSKGTYCLKKNASSVYHSVQEKNPTVRSCEQIRSFLYPIKKKRSYQIIKDRNIMKLL